MDLKTLSSFDPWQWGENAGALILKTLGDPNAPADERELAAEMGGDLVVMNDEMAGALIDVVKNPKEPDMLRAHAAIALGPVLEQTDLEGFEEAFPGDEPPISEFRFRQIQKTLRDVFEDPATPKEVRRRVLEGSVRAENDWHADAIRKAYTSGDREWMLTAVFGMRYVEGFEHEIVEALENPDEEIHVEAVRAAGEKEIDGAWPHVKKLVQDRKTPKDLLIAAIGALGSIRPKAAEELLEPLSRSRDQDVQAAVEDALMDYGEDDFDEDE